MIERRQFLKTLGLAGSAAALDSCAGGPTEQLIPYFVSPDAIVAGDPAYYATTCRGCPAGCGLVVKTVDGRITKAEGNPEHPIGRGRLCPRGQGQVQSVYNPFRFRQPLLRDTRGILQPLSWGDAEQMLAAKLREAKRRGANRVAWIGRLETEPFDSLAAGWIEALNSTRRIRFETFDHHALRGAGAVAFGRAEIPRYDFDRAEFVLAFGAEFLETWISNVEFTAAYSRLRARRLRDASGSFIWVAPRLSLTGLNADAWLPVPPGAEAAVACAIANAILAEEHATAARVPPAVARALDDLTPERVESAIGVPATAVREIARRLAGSRPSIVLGGGTTADGPDAIALEVAVFVLNTIAGNIGSTVRFGAGHALDAAATREDMEALVGAMHDGDVDVLLLHHSNPVYGLPPSVGFGDALAHVPFVVSFDTLQNESTDRAHLVLPDHHDLESWGAYAPRDGIVGLQQPAAAPLFDTRATADVLVEVARQIDPEVAAAAGNTPWRDRVVDSWAAAWDDVAHRGGHFTPEVPSPAVQLRDVSQSIRVVRLERTPSLTLLAYPTTQFYDGREADVSWLQELPDPVNKTVWTNCLELHPDTAARLGIGEADAVEITSPHGHVTAKAHLYRGLHPEAVALAIGYGRTSSMRDGGGRGADAIALLPKGDSGSRWRAAVSLRRVEGGRRLTVLQATDVETRRTTPSARLVAPDRVDVREGGPSQTVQFYPPHAHPEHRWGMAIDLNACIGCSACVVACYAENNVAVVGAERCAEGREMSWIRIEREERDAGEAPALRPTGAVFLPMLCQQCDNAPCEAVCPVYATYHNPEGLNAQVYARCIGTRFCSNNCPYKVRRFNWARYTWQAPLTEQLNPEVTVRSVGVMEKCTFCIQRIQSARMTARREQRTLQDGDIVPACAQTCPADAIVFGDLRDPSSRVSQLSAAARGYHVLEDLNTRPAITYLRRVVPGAPEHGD